MTWVFQVLLAKGVDPKVVDQLYNLYRDNITIVVVNNKLGRAYINHRMSLRQGDLPSMFWFSYAIDPLLIYLQKRLKGLPIFHLPVAGPVLHGEAPLPPLEDRYTVISYADDVKSAVTCMKEFQLVNEASLMFEKSSGCVLHRDPNSGKCKVLLVGRWRNSVQQEDIPLNYVQISEHLDMLGVVLKATATQTRMVNGDEVSARVRNKIKSWQGGRFMPLSQRPWSINSYVLSMVYFRCNSINLRVKDLNSINGNLKSWLFKDQLEKPEDIILYRPTYEGGLGLDHLKCKATARLIVSFLETAVSPTYIHSIYHEALFRYHVLDEKSINNPGIPMYISEEIFEFIKLVYNEGTNIYTMTSKQWYKALLDKTVLHEKTDSGEYIPKKCRAEIRNPNVDWGTTWFLARLKGLESEQVSFLWKMLHNILPCQSRINRIFTLNDSSCKLCKAPLDDLPHLFECSYSSAVCQALLKSVRSICGDATPTKILLLSLNVDRPKQFCVIWLISSTLLHVWELRMSKKSATLIETRAMLEAKINLLRKSRRLYDEATLIEELLMNFN